MEGWRKGFFDQSTSEAQEILRTAVKKRQAAADRKTEKSEGRSESSRALLLTSTKAPT